MINRLICVYQEITQNLFLNKYDKINYQDHFLNLEISEYKFIEFYLISKQIH